MPEAKLDVIVDPSGAITGSSRAKQAINSINDSTRKMAAEMEKARQAQERINAATQRMVRAIRAAGTAWLTYKAIINTYIRNSIEAERVETQLNAVLKSTRHAAGLTAIELKNMASEMQMLTAFGDEEVLSMQNILLTFKNIKGDEFKRATMAVLDLSTAMGQDLKSSAIQVGKALNDPKIGLTALQRVGITFSDSQKKLIKDLTETGRVAEAQRIIFKELESQFGGSAKAATNNLGGAIQQLKNKFGDLFEINATGEFGEMTKAVKELTKALDTQPVKDFTQELGTLIADGITGATKGLKLMADNIGLVKDALLALTSLKLSSWVLAMLGIGGAPAAAISLGVAAGATMLDHTAKGLETLSERRGLGLNKSGRSAEIQALRDLKALPATSISSRTNSLAAIKALDAAMSTATVESLIATTVTTPILDDIGGSSKSGKGSTETALERQIKLAQQAGQETAFAIERMQKQEELQKEVMLAVQEGEAKFNEEMAQVATDKAISAIEALKLQVDIGNISFEQYREALTKIREQFSMFPGAVEQIDSAMKALDISIQASTRTLGSFVREAETALKDKLTGIPDELSGAFAGAIAYGEDLGDTLKSLAKDIAYATIKAFILKSIFGGGGGGRVSDWHDAGNAILAKAKGGVFNASGVTPFANGGIVNKPTLFPFANGIGLMGEAGAEAIMPLKRTSSGDLGVQAEGGGGENVTVNMTINAMDSKSVVDMLTKNKGTIESLVVSTFRRNGALRGAIRQGV